jgi:hypothetical protein
LCRRPPALPWRCHRMHWAPRLLSSSRMAGWRSTSAAKPSPPAPGPEPGLPGPAALGMDTLRFADSGRQRGGPAPRGIANPRMSLLEAPRGGFRLGRTAVCAPRAGSYRIRPRWPFAAFGAMALVSAIRWHTRPGISRAHGGGVREGVAAAALARDPLSGAIAENDGDAVPRSWDCGRKEAGPGLRPGPFQTQPGPRRC